MPTYKSIHTTYGLAKMASAEASGIPINLTHMAVGDGNGNPVTPTEGQTVLVREMYRSTVNRVYQDTDDATLFWCELIVPATEGGFTMREIGVFDFDGSLFVVGNLPDTYKPNISEGSYSDAVVRVGFKVSNASIITLQIDPSVAVATQTWIINNVTPATLFPGGTTNQILKKASNADGDTVWGDPTVADIVVDLIQETQTLAAAQTAVVLTLCTTNGLAIYIEGVRLREDQWTAVDATHLTLGASYPADTKLVAVQNEPSGTNVFPLARDQNLADVPNKATARTNLDVFSKAESNQLTPVSAVLGFPRTTAPTGWLKCNGAAISRVAYANLFAVIGTTFGAGDGFNTFNLPDYRGEFPRWLDDGRGIDVGRTLAAAQAEGVKLSGTFYSLIPGGVPPDGVFSVIAASSAFISGGPAGFSHSLISLDGGSSETRPRNRALLACMKY